MNEAKEQVRTMPQARETTMQHSAHHRYVTRRSVPQPLLDVAMAVFFGVEFGCMRGQPLHLDFGMVGQVSGHGFALMDRRTIPHQDEPFGHVAQQVAQSHDHVCAVHGFVKLPRIDLSRQGQADSHRHGPTFVCHPAQGGALALGRPCAPQQFPKGITELVKEYDFYAVPTRLFLYGASRPRAMPGSTLHRAPQPALRATGGSNRACEANEAGSAHDS